MTHHCRTALLGALIALFLLGACVPQQTPTEPTTTAPEATEPTTGATEPSAPDTDALVDISRAYVLDMVAGEFAELYGATSAAVKAQLSEAALQSAFAQTADPIGAFVAVQDASASAQGAYTVVEVICEYTGNGLRVTFAYGKDGTVESLWFSYAPIERDNAVTDLYEESDMQIGDGAGALSGKLVLPKGVERPPVAVLVHGSGQHGYDSPVGKSGNAILRDLAYGLAERGIASIRYNKRFFEYPQAAQALGVNVTISDEVLDDAAEAIRLASGDSRLGDVFVIGHSLGGMLVPKIAADNPQVRGLVSLAGSPRRLEDIILDQNNAVIAAMPGTDASRAAARAQVEAEVAKVKALTGRETYTVLGMPAPYWYSLNQIDTPALLKALSLPMLIAQGDADFQVYADKDFVLWQQLLAGRDSVTFALYEGLNHLFMPTQGRSDTSDYDPPAAVDPRVLDDIAQWAAALAP